MYLECENEDKIIFLLKNSIDYIHMVSASQLLQIRKFQGKFILSHSKRKLIELN